MSMDPDGAVIGRLEGEEQHPDEPDAVIGGDAINPGYDRIGWSTADSASDAIRAWLNMLYPDDTDGRIMIEDDHHIFVQNPDGSGFVEHGGEMGPCAIRTADGIAAVNQSHGHSLIGDSLPDGVRCGSMHGKIERHLRNHDDYEWELRPFEFLMDVLEFQTEMDPDGFMRSITLIDRHQPDLETHKYDSPGTLFTSNQGRSLYIGSDPTATRGNELFGFVVPEDEQAPRAFDAIELLKPDEVAQAEAQGRTVKRQGEWFLVEMGETPRGTIQNPGIGSRPFGVSPLDSHIPQDWATIVPDETFLRRYHDISYYQAGITEEVESPQQAVEEVVSLAEEQDDDSWFDMLTTMAGAVCVRGTFKHRDRDHFDERVEGWHRAYTHDYDVIVADEQGFMMVD